MKAIRILLVDNHSLIRAGIRALLQAIPDVEVVAEASNGREALNLVSTKSPNAILMDIAMPEMNGLEATARITKDFPDVRTIILSMYTSEEYVLQALRAGASGYLLKEADTVELELALRAVMRGENYLSPSVSKHVVADYVRRISGETGPLDQLTPRQREILQMIAEGCTTKTIARKLHLSVKTVETHRTQIMARLDLHDVAGLVRFAIRVGLISPEASD